ncbi:processing protein TSR1 homolog [Seminavis robusta]|uniref:Processing protein TSR1 homolog n=1 Tax=Seminavis robusta TaxID=568900 RepID=A0A9N8EB41_9STRA|nr:processing protein TSR1 homolog [Seminavis robusta]|eukprot:Sro750_g196960.1 processing protein TSR1 homolog (896) ;mRNA; r:22321-25008
MPGHHHRSGTLRQQNKKNKRSTSSKRSLSRAAGGKVNARTRSGQSAALFARSKADRANRLQQKRDSKRAELLRRKRGVSGGPAPPRVVGIISLGASEEIEEKLRNSLLEKGETLPGRTNATVTTKFGVHKKDGALTFLTNSTSFRAQYDKDFAENDAAVQSALDLCRVCDMIVFVIDTHASVMDNVVDIQIGGNDDPSAKTFKSASSNNQGLNHWDHLISDRGDRILHAVKSQGLPSLLTVLAITDDEDAGADDMMSVKSVKSARRSKTKRLQSLRKYASRFALAEFGPDKDTVMDVDVSNLHGGMEAENQEEGFVSNPEADIAALVRALCTKAAAPSKWVMESPRPFVLSDSVHFDAANRELKISGYIRGKIPLSVNSLLHVPNVGTYGCKKIERIEPLLSRRKHTTDSGMVAVLTSDPNKQESLDMFASPDALEGEQNLVGFDEEGDFGDEAMNAPEDTADKKFSRPAGWSDYQSAWLDAVDDVGAEFDAGELAEELNKKKSSSNSTVGGMDIDDANEISDAERLLLKEKRTKEQNEHNEFPDEVDVGEDEKAMDRFARYRSLKSFRKSYWDPKENLPESYANVFHFANFKATQRSVMQEMEDLAADAEEWNGESPQTNSMDEDDSGSEDLFSDCVPSGAYVTITLNGVDANAANSLPVDSVLVAVALLPHENKVSVLHAGLSHSSGCNIDNEFPVKSKDKLTIRCGWRTWETRPVFSQNNLNCNKHKFERFMPLQGAFFAATFFGPVTYTPCPVLVFRKQEDKPQELCAIGSMIGADADRIVVKRVILTGYPVRVHKRHATVKYMFYNPDDVKWFRPAGLWTKHGLNGNIVESVGDHGTMKCLFNAPIKQHDTVCLPLYKRIFPKFVLSQATDRQEGSKRMEATEKPTLVVR